jgi:hypothetical protein
VKSLDGSDSQQSTTNPQTGYTQYFQCDRLGNIKLFFICPGQVKNIYVIQLVQ